MGILDFFKIRKKEQNNEIEEVRFENLISWLDLTSQEVTKKFKYETENLFRILEESVDFTEQKLAELKAASLENKKADPRIKSIVLQNKGSYVEHVEKLLENIKKELALSGKDEIENVGRILAVISAKINIFSKQSTKSFYAASELIGKELEEVVDGIKKIKNVIKEFEKLETWGVLNVENAKRIIFEIIERERIKKNFHSKIENYENEIKDIDKRIEQLKAEDKEIIGSKAWLEKQEFIKKIKVLSEEQEKNKEKVRVLFASVEKAISKFVWKEEEKELLNYVKEPFEALEQDKELKIIKKLIEIKKMIENDELKFDSSKKEKMIKNIESVSQHIPFLLKKKEEIEKEIAECKQQIASITVERINFELEIEKKVEIEKEAKKYKKEYDELNMKIEKRKEEVEKLIKGFGKEIKIIY